MREGYGSPFLHARGHLYLEMALHIGESQSGREVVIF